MPNHGKKKKSIGRTIVCERCHTEVVNKKFCWECGAPLPGTIKCPGIKCGMTTIHTSFCCYCGQKLPPNERIKMSPKAK